MQHFARVYLQGFDHEWISAVRNINSRVRSAENHAAIHASLREFIKYDAEFTVVNPEGKD